MSSEDASVAHLSEESLDEILIGSGTAADASHLASCEQCAARLETFRCSMALFNQASTDWAQARANSISRELTPRRVQFAILPAWAVAAAFFFAVALSFLVGIHRGLTPNQATVLDGGQVVAGAASDRQDEIASDNEMLHAIDTAISQPVSSPVEVHTVKKTGHAAPPRIAAHEVRD